MLMFRELNEYIWNKIIHYWGSWHCVGYEKEVSSGRKKSREGEISGESLKVFRKTTCYDCISRLFHILAPRYEKAFAHCSFLWVGSLYHCLMSVKLDLMPLSGGAIFKNDVVHELGWKNNHQSNPVAIYFSLIYLFIYFCLFVCLFTSHTVGFPLKRIDQFGACAASQNVESPSTAVDKEVQISWLSNRSIILRAIKL